jgi:hypothetical protein
VVAAATSVGGAAGVVWVVVVAAVVGSGDVGGGCVGESLGVLGVDAIGGKNPGDPERPVVAPENAPTCSRCDTGRVLAVTRGAVAVEAVDGAEVLMAGRAMGLAKSSPLASAAAGGGHGVSPSVA